jgi:hypothetical protein
MAQSNTKPPFRPIVTSLRFSLKEHEALKSLAARENRTVSGQLRHVIEKLAAEAREQERTPA